MAGGSSTIASFNFQQKNLLSLRSSLSMLEQQIATQKRSTIFGTMGTRTQEVQRLRADVNLMDGYIDNINAASIRGDIMDNALTEMTKIAKDMRDAITLTPAAGTNPDVAYIQELGKTSMDFLEELLNTEINGRYLFAGSSISTEPYEGSANLFSTVQDELTAWFDGTQTVDQFLANIDAMSGTDLGYDLSLNSAGSVTARIDDGRDVDYTVLANEQGFLELVRTAAVLSNMDFPDPNDPFVTATTDEYYQVMATMANNLDNSITNITQSQARLALARNNMNAAKTQHQNEQVAFANVISDIEDVDLAESIAKLQQVQTQLNASYQTISTVSQLSLSNFL